MSIENVGAARGSFNQIADTVDAVTAEAEVPNRLTEVRGHVEDMTSPVDELLMRVGAIATEVEARSNDISALAVRLDDSHDALGAAAAEAGANATAALGALGGAREKVEETWRLVQDAGDTTTLMGLLQQVKNEIERLSGGLGQATGHAEDGASDAHAAAAQIRAIQEPM